MCGGGMFNMPRDEVKRLVSRMEASCLAVSRGAQTTSLPATKWAGQT